MASPRRDDAAGDRTRQVTQFMKAPFGGRFGGTPFTAIPNLDPTVAQAMALDQALLQSALERPAGVTKTYDVTPEEAARLRRRGIAVDRDGGVTPTGLASIAQPQATQNPFVRTPFSASGQTPLGPQLLEDGTPNVQYQADARSIIDSPHMDADQKQRALFALQARAGGTPIQPEQHIQDAQARTAVSRAATLVDVQKRTDKAVIESRTKEYERARAFAVSNGATTDELQQLEDQYRISISTGLSQPNPVLQAIAEDDEENPKKKLARSSSAFLKRYGGSLLQYGVTEEDVMGSLWLDPETGAVQGVKELKELYGIREPTPGEIHQQEADAFAAIDNLAAHEEATGGSVDPAEVLRAKMRARDALRSTASFVPPTQTQETSIFGNPVTVEQYASFGEASDALIRSLGGAGGRPNIPAPPAAPKQTLSPQSVQASSQLSSQTGAPIVTNQDDYDRVLADARARGAKEISMVVNGKLITRRITD